MIILSMSRQKIVKQKTTSKKNQQYLPRKKSAKSKAKSKERKINTLLNKLQDTGPRFTVMSIDPGSDNLGWSIAKYDCGKKTLISFGAITTSDKKSESAVNGFISIMDKMFKIWDKYEIDAIVIEEYTPYGGKFTGASVVPSLIYLIDYEWYRRTETEIVRIPLSIWKQTVCRDGSASKADILQSVSPMVSSVFPGTNEKIQKQFSAKETQHERDGMQDCYDSLGVLLYTLAMADIATKSDCELY